MYDIKLDNVKKGKKFFFIFFISGVAIAVIMIGILIGSTMNLNSLDATTMSTSVEINQHIDSDGNTMYSPVYHYNVNGEEYSCSSNSSSSIRPSESNALVYYDSKKPSRCMTSYSKSSNKMLLIFLILPVIFIALGVVNINKVNKRIKIIKELNTKGKLVKNLPYRLENSNMKVNGVPIQLPVVDYILPSGVTITLRGDPRHDNKLADADGMVDLVIDESNPENYFIDFEINRLTGNLQSDYYKGNINNVTNINQNNLQNNDTIVNNVSNNMSNNITHINNSNNQNVMNQNSINQNIANNNAQNSNQNNINQ